MYVFHIMVLAGVRAALLLFQLPVNEPRKALGPYTHRGDWEGVPGSLLQLREAAI